MKKFLFAIVALVAMVACNGGNQNNEAEETTQECGACPETLCLTTLNEALACDDVETIKDALTTAQVEITKLLSEQKNGEAYSLADAVLLAIAENAEHLTEVGYDYAEVAAALEGVKVEAEGNLAQNAAAVADAEAEAATEE